MGRPKKVVKEPSPTEQSDFQFFTEVDFNQHDNVGSMFPAYTNITLIEDLKNDINKAEIALNNQNISPERRQSVSKELDTRKERLYIIENSKPKFDDKKLMTVEKEMADLITSSMFRKSEMDKGLADAHEEARRMVEKLIPVTSDVANVMLGCNIKIDPDNKKVSRNELVKAWKTIKKIHGENSNVEQLRRG